MTEHNQSLDEILEDLVLSGLEAGRDGDLAKAYHEQDGDDDWTAWVKKHFPLADEAKQALTTLVEGQVAQALHKIYKHFPDFDDMSKMKKDELLEMIATIGMDIAWDIADAEDRGSQSNGERTKDLPQASSKGLQKQGEQNAEQ